jgi:hypothetical protein
MDVSMEKGRLSFAAENDAELRQLEGWYRHLANGEASGYGVLDVSQALILTAAPKTSGAPAESGSPDQRPSSVAPSPSR